MLTIIFIFLTLIAYTLLYFALLWLVPTFFNQKHYNIATRKTVRSLLIFLPLTLVFLLIANYLISGEFGNRIQHAIAGGFTAYMIYFLSVKDSGVKISPFQALVFGFLLISTLGVLNELLEFILQNSIGIIFNNNDPLDTWKDLASNTFGILLAMLVFTMQKRKL